VNNPSRRARRSERSRLDSRAGGVNATSSGARATQASEG